MAASETSVWLHAEKKASAFKPRFFSGVLKISQSRSARSSHAL